MKTKYVKVEKCQCLYERVFAMPNKNTFQIKPIADFIMKYRIPGKELDPFPEPYQRDALEVLKEQETESVNFGLYDPPYSQRQLVEMYAGLGQSVEVNSGYWRKLEDEWKRIIIPSGRLIRFGWNSKILTGFDFLAGLMVYHGGQHNDTIVTAQVKTQTRLN